MRAQPAPVISASFDKPLTEQYLVQGWWWWWWWLALCLCVANPLPVCSLPPSRSAAEAPVCVALSRARPAPQTPAPPLSETICDQILTGSLSASHAGAAPETRRRRASRGKGFLMGLEG